VTLNIDAGQKTSEPGADPGSAALRPLVDQALAELTSWNPREFVAAFQRWHQGSVSLIHLNVLAMLEVHGPLAMSRIAELLDISVASVTGVIDRMEKRGLVERRHDVDDRRVVLVHPAAGGRELFTDIDGRRREHLARLLTHIADADLAALLQGHRALRAARAAFGNGSDGPNDVATDHAKPGEAEAP
jgi:DNA-binding MarR family transcriptional regulator